MLGANVAGVLLVLAGKESGANVSVCGVAPSGAPKRGAPERCEIEIVGGPALGVPFTCGTGTGPAEEADFAAVAAGGGRTVSQLMLRSALLAMLLVLASDALR